ncbi:MAG: hypothetical protein RL204_898 [Bacteroidota bacterium]|jgi:AraC-like DNA-binding protein
MKAISQYQLKDTSGKPTEFSFEDWGKSSIDGYNHLQAHRHNFYEIMIFTSGEAQHDIDFVTYNVDNTAAHFIAPDNVHLLIRNPHCTGFSLQFEKGFIEDNLILELPFSSGHPCMSISEELLKQIKLFYNLIKEECAQNRSESTAILRSFFQSLVLLLIRSNKDQLNSYSDTKKPQLFLDFTQLVKRNFRSRPKVEDYAKELHVSTKHLISICKNNSGKTPLKIIQDEIIGEAKRLLFYTEKPIKEIAMTLGFDDPSNFSNFFKTTTGYSPLSYREKSK